MQPEVPGLREYAKALQRVEPSAALNARIEALIERSAAKHPWRESVFERPLFAVAAAVAGALILATYAVAFLIPSESRETSTLAARNQEAAPPLVIDSSTPPPWSPADTVPIDAVVLRVPTGLKGAGAAVPAVAADARELRFWVDVRVATDGSMRVVRVVPADITPIHESNHD